MFGRWFADVKRLGELLDWLLIHRQLSREGRYGSLGRSPASGKGDKLLESAESTCVHESPLTYNNSIQI